MRKRGEEEGEERKEEEKRKREEGERRNLSINHPMFLAGNIFTEDHFSCKVKTTTIISKRNNLERKR